MFIRLHTHIAGTEIAYMRYDQTQKYLGKTQEELENRANKASCEYLLSASEHVNSAQNYMQKVWRIAKNFPETFDESKHPTRFSDGTSLITFMAQMEHTSLTNIAHCTNSVNRSLFTQGLADLQRKYFDLSHNLLRSSLSLDKAQISLHEHLYIHGFE